MKAIYIHDYHQFMTDSSSTEQQLKLILKQQYGLSIRRINRFILLSLLSGLQFQGRDLDEVYWASSFSSTSNLQNMLKNLRLQNFPKPFDFLSGIHNAVLFHIANQLNITGSAIFNIIDGGNSWTNPLLHALTDLQDERQKSILVGWAHEAKTYDQIEQEGSHCLILSNQPNNALARIEIVDNHASDVLVANNQDPAYYFATVADFFNSLTQKEIILLPTVISNKNFLISLL